MSTKKTILTPIRYPLTESSVRTLQYASELAADEPTAELLVLHVNLYQSDIRSQRSEISRAIKPVLNGTDASLMLRTGFLIEDVIADEATQTGADIVVMGENQKPTWRRALSRLFGNDPSVSTYLRDRTDTTVHVVG